MDELFIGCTIKELPEDQIIPAAATAIAQNPFNRVSPGKIIGWLERIRKVVDLFGGEPETTIIPPEHIAIMTSKYWGVGGVKLTVGFPFDSAPNDLQNRIVSHMNAWGERCNVQFTLTNGQADVRITRAQSGYWSYLGTDIKHIPINQPTMCLQNFTMSTPESEFRRVIRHETGHTLGCPHEHARAELVNRLDVQKTLVYFAQTQGWSVQMTRQQVLTPLSESSIMGTPNADQDSIMTYQLPGSITKDGQPIRGGTDINESDYVFMASKYPKAIIPPIEPPVVSDKTRVTIVVGGGFANIEKVEPVE